MSSSEAKIKHLEFIQGVINRLAANSFLLKGWTITLTAALFAFAAQDADLAFAFIAPFSAFAFWGLDAYYLRQERLYRLLYHDVAIAPEDGSSTIPPYSLNVSPYEKRERGWFATLWSPSVLCIHGLNVIFVEVLIALKLFQP